MSARGAPCPPRQSRDGFTLLEVLVAFLILAVFSGTVARSLVAGRASARGAMGVTAAEAVARTLMEGPTPKELGQPGRIQGRLDGLDWVMTTEAIALPPPAARPRRRDSETRPEDDPGDGGDGGAADPAAPPAWQPLRLTISVAAGPARSVTVETVRLVRLEPVR